MTTTQKPKHDVKPVDFKLISKVLKELHIPDSDVYLQRFYDEYVTDGDLSLLEDTDIEILFPCVGPRIRFRAWLRKYRNKPSITLYSSQKDVNQIQQALFNIEEDWILLCRQKTPTLGGGYFSKTKNWNYSTNKDAIDSNLYMNLAINYDEYCDKTGRLYFMVSWPGLCKIDKRLIYEEMIWSQQSTPIQSTVVNFEPIFVPYPGVDKPFLGIELSQSTNFAIIDGNAGIGNWHYCIASLQAWNNGILGPSAYNKHYTVHHVELFLLNYPKIIYKFAQQLKNFSCYFDDVISNIVAVYSFDNNILIHMMSEKIFKNL